MLIYSRANITVVGVTDKQIQLPFPVALVLSVETDVFRKEYSVVASICC